MSSSFLTLAFNQDKMHAELISNHESEEGVIYVRRLFVMSDVHGYYDAMKALLERVSYHPRYDVLVLLGDYVNYGPKSPETVEAVMWLQSQGAVVLRGNHEQMYIDYVNGDNAKAKRALTFADPKERLRTWYEKHKDVFYRHVEFFESLPLSYRYGSYLFVHAGVAPDGSTKNEYFALWNTEFWKQDTSNLPFNIVHGHTPIYRMVQDFPNIDVKRPAIFGNKICVDFGTASVHRGGFLGIVQLAPTIDWELEFIGQKK